jgi:hypothetical protein
MKLALICLMSQVDFLFLYCDSVIEVSGFWPDGGEGVVERLIGGVPYDRGF